MFPHIITVFNVVTDNNGIVHYYKKEVSDVFAHTQKIVSQEGKGEKYTSAHDVIFSSIALNDYIDIDSYLKLEDKSNKFTLKSNDIIVIGTFSDITGLSDIQKTNADYFLIKTISDNRYGLDTNLNNIEVTD